MRNLFFRPWAVLPAVMIASGILLGIGSDAFAAPPAKGDEKVVVAIIGSFDIDRDGQSDLKLLLSLVNKSGVQVAIEVDAQGVRKPTKGKITPQMKYLLVGKLLDPTKITDPKERKTAEQILTHFQALRAEARKAGVRVEDVPSLLTYGSYRARHYVNPGFYMEWPPKPGSENDEADRNRKLVRSIFSRRKRLKQPPTSRQ